MGGLAVHVLGYAVPYFTIDARRRLQAFVVPYGVGGFLHVVHVVNQLQAVNLCGFGHFAAFPLSLRQDFLQQDLGAAFKDTWT